MRQTLVGIDPVVKKLSVPIACDGRAGFFRVRYAIRQALGEPLREFTDR